MQPPTTRPMTRPAHCAFDTAAHAIVFVLVVHSHFLPSHVWCVRVRQRLRRSPLPALTRNASGTACIASTYLHRTRILQAIERGDARSSDNGSCVG